MGLGALDHFPNATASPFQAPPGPFGCVSASGLTLGAEPLALRFLLDSSGVVRRGSRFGVEQGTERLDLDPGRQGAVTFHLERVVEFGVMESWASSPIGSQKNQAIPTSPA